MYAQHFQQNFYQYVTVYYLRIIWTYKNAVEKAHIFSWRKNVPKRTKEKHVPKRTKGKTYQTEQKRTKNGYCVNPPSYCDTVVPNLFLTVAHFDFENFPWPHSQTIAQELDPNFPAKSVLK